MEQVARLHEVNAALTRKVASKSEAANGIEKGNDERARSMSLEIDSLKAERCTSVVS